MRISSGGGEASAARPALVPDVAMARQFLGILDRTAADFHFQAFADQKSAPSAVAAPLAQGIYGALDAIAGHLSARNRQGAGIFVAVNALVPDKPRRKAHVQRVRAVLLDLDAPQDTLPPFPLEPHLVVESSPGRHHVYWLVEGLPVDQFAPLQKSLARRYQGDPVVSDACRVMRLPGFYHRKDPSRPVMARLIAHRLHPPYAPGQIRETLLGEAAGAPLSASIQESTPAATPATLDHARRLAQEAARRTREDPRLSRHAEVVRLGHYLRRDGIPLTRRVGQLVLDELLAHLRPTAAGSGEPAPFPREEAARALRDAYRMPSDPDRPRAVLPALTAGSGGEEDWPDPGIISLAPAGRAFPLEALPPSARAAVARMPALRPAAPAARGRSGARGNGARHAGPCRRGP